MGPDGSAGGASSTATAASSKSRVTLRPYNNASELLFLSSITQTYVPVCWIAVKADAEVAMESKATTFMVLSSVYPYRQHVRLELNSKDRDDPLQLATELVGTGSDVALTFDSRSLISPFTITSR